MEQGVIGFYREFQRHRHVGADLRLFSPEDQAHAAAMQHKADEVVTKLITDGLTIAESQLVLNMANLFLLGTHAVLPIPEDDDRTE